MIYLLLILGSFVFYFSIVGYLSLVSSKFQNKKSIKWILWLVFCVWVGIWGLGGIRLVKIQYPELNGIVGMVPVAVGFIASLIIKKNLWKMCHQQENGR